MFCNKDHESNHPETIDAVEITALWAVSYLAWIMEVLFDCSRRDVRR
jgi:hypothetical protein